MLALALWRARRCPHCGRDIDECTGPEEHTTYRVPDPIRCHATTALSIAQQTYRDVPHADALLWRTERKG